MNSAIVSCISGNGIVLSPKADGRLEIPQSIVRLFGWNNKSTIRISRQQIGLKLTTKELFEESYATKVSCGRVRIPAGIIKEFGFYQKQMLLFICNNDEVIIRPKIDECNLTSIINKIDKEILDQLWLTLNGCSHNEPTVPLIVNEKSVRNLTDSGDKIKPQLFTLNTNAYFIFRIVGMAYRVAGKSYGNVVTITRNGTDKFYLIPGIRVNDNSFGFLLLDSDVFGFLSSLIREHRIEKTLYSRNTIFMYNSFDCRFSIYFDPVESHHLQAIAEEVCKDPEKFIGENLESRTFTLWE